MKIEGKLSQDQITNVLMPLVYFKNQMKRFIELVTLWYWVFFNFTFYFTSYIINLYEDEPT
jgi:hypothetical protein